MTAQQIAANAFTAEIQDRYELQTAIEAYAASRVAECREQTVRECAEVYRKHAEKAGYAPAMIRLDINAILSVAAPKPPVWKHREGCPTPYVQSGDDGFCYTMGRETYYPPYPMHYCPGCGAEKPEVTR